MQIVTNMEQYMLQGNQIYQGWNRINSSERFITLNIPQEIFKGPIRRMFILNTTDLNLMEQKSIQKNEENNKNEQNSVLQKSELVFRNRYYITLSQMMVQTKQDEDTSYVNIQKKFGQIIGAAYFEPDDVFVFLMQKKIIFMPSQNKNVNNLQDTSIIFQNHPLDYDYSQCSLTHHKNWRLFFVLCKGTDQTELNYQTYTLFVDKQDINTNQNQTNFSEKAKWTKVECSAPKPVKIESYEQGVIQTILLSENNNESFGLDKLVIFFMTKVDKNYDESIIKVQSLNSEILFQIFNIDANALNRRTLSAIDISVLSFASEIDQKELFLVSLLTQNEIIFVILSQTANIMYRSFIKNERTEEEGFFQNIDLQKIQYYRQGSIPCINIHYNVQFEKRDAFYQSVVICNTQKVNINLTAGTGSIDWVVIQGPTTIETYKHYKSCAQYSGKPVPFWRKNVDKDSDDKSPVYLARFCVFNQNIEVQSTIGQETSSKSFHLILYTNKEGVLQQTQTVIELPFFNNKPSSIFFYQESNPEKSVHMLVTSYINLYIDYLIQNSYKLNLYFKFPQEFLLSKKRVLIQGENDHFSNYAVLDYNVIDYMITDPSQFSTKMLYAKSIISLILLVIYIIPIVSFLVDKRKKKKVKRQKIKDETSPRFIIGRLREREQSVFGEEIRQQNSPDNRYTYDNHMSTPSQYIINSNTDNDSDNEYS